MARPFSFPVNTTHTPQAYPLIHPPSPTPLLEQIKQSPAPRVQPASPATQPIVIPGMLGSYQISLINPEALARTLRGQSIDTNHTASSFSDEKIIIKPDEIGTFDLQADNPEGEGIVEINSKPVYTDIYAFFDALQTLREDPETKASADKQIVRHFHTLLRSLARF